MPKRCRKKNVIARRIEKKIRRRTIERRQKLSEDYKIHLIELFKKEYEENDNLVRTHANFFHSKNKYTIELIVTIDLFRLIENELNDYALGFNDGEDPPDVKVTTKNEKIYGVEVCELVNEKAIRHQINEDKKFIEPNKRHYAFEVISWNKEKFIEHLNEIIIKKDRKCKTAKEDYTKMVLLIFTDEPRLEPDTIRSYLKGYILPELQILKAIYILTSPDSRHGKGKQIIPILSI